MVANSKKTDISKQGLNSIDNPTVKLNLMGQSKTMKDKNWVDPQGRKGKVRLSPPPTPPAFRRLEPQGTEQSLCFRLHR